MLYWAELRVEGGRSHQRVMMTRWWLFIVYVVVIFVSMCIIERKKEKYLPGACDASASQAPAFVSPFVIAGSFSGIKRGILSCN